VSLEADTLTGFESSPHLAAPQFGPAKSALLALARKIDAWDDVVAAAVEHARENGTRPTVPQNDNVSLSAYFKALDTLGLTPAGWAKITGSVPTAPTKPEGVPDDDSNGTSTGGPGGKEARLTEIRSGVHAA
jgi:hypothetical protein